MAFVRGFGAYLPARVVANQDLAEQLGCSADWILQVSGIRERRYAGDDESVADLAASAARDCLARAGPASVGLVLVASGTSERRFPGPAAVVAHQLGLAGVPALDLPLASAGSLFGLALAARLAPSFGDVLVVAAEKMSAVLAGAPPDRNIAILFGDGAGACLVSPREGPARLLDACLHSDGAFSEDLQLGLSGPLRMNGGSVILHAARKLPAVIRELLDRNGRSPGDIQAFLMHQANQNLTDRVAAAVGVDPAKFFSNIARYGNTSSASMLIAAHEWSLESGFVAGQPVVFAGFGAGFHWGAALAVGE